MYIAKAAAICGYISKGNGDLENHLNINGGRSIHMSRGFLHGWTSREVLAEMSAGIAWHLELDNLEGWYLADGELKDVA